MSKVKSLGEYKNDATMMRPEDALHGALDDIASGVVTPTKVLVILLDDRDGMYAARFVQSGMKMSECVALCEVMKHNLIVGQMGM